jgi:hypothetical protein
MEKAKNAGISLYPSEVETLRDQAKIRDGGSPTRYVRRLMEADAAGIMTPTAYDDQILDKLAVTYFGYHAPQFAEQLDRTQADQPATLHALLSGLSEAIACGATVDAGCDCAPMGITAGAQALPSPAMTAPPPRHPAPAPWLPVLEP